MKVHLRLVGRRSEGEDVESFLFQPDGPFPYQAGQHLRLTIPHVEPDARGSSRYFTIASAPSEPALMVTTRLVAEPSSFKRALARLPVGALVEASGPGGGFVYPSDCPPALFVAGGIGITPFRSMLIDLFTRDLTPDIVLLYSNRTAIFPFRTLLQDLARARASLRLVPSVTRPTPDWDGPVGRIDDELIKRAVPDLRRRLAFVAGPRPMVEAASDAMLRLGADPSGIKLEIFPGYESSSHDRR